MFLTHVASLHSLGTEGYPAQFEQVLLLLFYLMLNLPSIFQLILLLFLLLLVLVLLILLHLILLRPIILLLILLPLIIWLLIRMLLILLRLILLLLLLNQLYSVQVNVGRDKPVASLIASHPSNREKNRYNNVLPCEDQ